MIKSFLKLGWLGMLALATTGAHAQTQATLGTSPYVETFDGLASGLPTGFGIYTGATASSLGTAATLTTAATAWNNTAGAFKNFASADIGSTATSAAQASATDRALGVRQTGTVGDPGASFVFQVANTTGRTDFALMFSLQSLDAASPRTAVWTVDYGVGTAPTSFTTLATGTGTTGGTAFSNTPIRASFGTALDDISGPITIRISTLAGTTGSGNRPTSAIDDFQLTWNTPTATTPVLTVTPNTLAFGSQNINVSSAPKTYSLSGVNLSGATTVAATGPFTIAKSATGPFSTTLSFTPADLAAATPVYVRFTPTATGAATGSLSNVSAGATSRPVALSGTGVDPNQTVFNFDNCTGTTTLSDGWSQYSVTGPQTWACTTFGHSAADPTASAPNGVQMNGYASSNIENEDWFISPAFNLSAYNFPLFSFWSRTAFTGPALKLRVSTNYSGTGNPNAATWTDVNVLFPGVGSDTWTQTANINLGAFKAANVYVAFVYTSTTSAAARWTLDDIAITNSATPPAPSILTDVKTLAFGFTAPGSSKDRTLNVSGNDLTGPVTLTSSDPLFTLSKDGATFGTTLTLTAAEASAKAVTVRFQPTTAFATFTGTISVSTPGAAAILRVALSGDTYDTNKTLEVVNWNVEWFGSTVSGNGPTNKALQQTNVSTVVNYLNADIYALAEVVDTVRLQNVVTQLSTATGHPYTYQVSRYGSYGDNPQDPDYVNDQKLAFVYRTDVLSNVSTGIGLLRCTEAQNCPAYNAWAGGRFPYLMSADVTLDGVSKRVNFIVLHAKANATATSANDYARRKLGATLLKNLLDTQYPNQNTLIVGDYNDVLEGTIATGIPAPAVSSYDVLVSDSTNYVSLTLPLARAGAQSTASYATVIDNVIATKPLANYYIKGTAAIRTDAAALITNYATTTSDHYPVFTRYSFASPDLVVSTANQIVAGGNYNSITVTSTGSGTLQGPVQVSTSLTVQSGGSLDTNCQPITGSGSFTVADGGTLSICDAAGIATMGSTGAVQVTGTRSFASAASYVYNGTTTQITGAGLPTQVLNLTTTNANNLTLTRPLAVAQTLTVANSGNLVLNNQTLTLLSSATSTALVVNSGTGTVQGATATVQRYLDGSRNAGPGYRQLSAPVSGSTVADLATANFTPVVNPAYNTSAQPTFVQPFPTVYGYDESRLSLTNNLPLFDKGWYSPTTLADPLVVAKGYTVNMPANQVVDFVGTLNNGDYSQTLTRQSQAAEGGWHLVGNPYPAPLSSAQISAADRSNLDAAIYISQSTGQYTNTYRSYVNGIGVGSIIPLGQAFFVRVSAGQSSGTLTLRNSQRNTSYVTQVSVQRTTADTRPRLNLTLNAPSGSADELYVYAESGATTGFDGEQDAAKMPNNNGLNLAALTSTGQPLSIQGLPTLAGRLALSVEVPAAGTYSLTAAELLNLPAGVQPVLEDTKTGQHTTLTAAGTSYSFAVAAGENLAGRFWLNLTTASPLATASALQTDLALYPNPTHEGQATLLVPAGTAAGQVQVLDALGRLVRQQSLVVGGATTLKLAGLPAGVYVVRVQAGSEQATRRLTIN